MLSTHLKHHQNTNLPHLRINIKIFICLGNQNLPTYPWNAPPDPQAQHFMKEFLSFGSFLRMPRGYAPKVCWGSLSRAQQAPRCLQETVRRLTGFRPVCVCDEHCPGSSLFKTLRKQGVIRLPILRGSNNANVGDLEAFP